MDKQTRFIRWFAEMADQKGGFVVDKDAVQGRMYHLQGALGIPVPNGFVVTVEAYQQFLRHTGVASALDISLDKGDVQNPPQLAKYAQEICNRVLTVEFPVAVREAILEAYGALKTQYGDALSVIVSTSLSDRTNSQDGCYAAEQTTIYHVRDEEALIAACRRCYSTLFTEEAIINRRQQGLDPLQADLALVVKKMARSDLACSGLVYSLDIESGYREIIYITGAYGLGENIVQYALDPDEYYVHKPMFKTGFKSVLRRRLGDKEIQMVCDQDVRASNSVNIATPSAQRQRYCLNRDEVLILAEYAIKIENYFSELAGSDVPVRIQWAKDGVDGQIYIVQAIAHTKEFINPANVIREYEVSHNGDWLARGHAIGNKVAVGKARIIRNIDELSEFQPGEVLVSDLTTSEWGAVMKHAVAIVTNRGGRTCHAAITARELGMPAVVGTGNATEVLRNGDIITLSCAQGEHGFVYAGKLDFKINELRLDKLGKPKTHITMNIANPDLAFRSSLLPNDGVGLARLEFIISETIKIHPLAFVYTDQISDEMVFQQVKELTREYADSGDYFVDKLSEGVATIAAAFFPKPVIVRLSDFKSNEYSHLLAGTDFEPKEENPVIGLRGASRYIHPEYIEAFRLECLALKRVREVMGYSNVKLMIPFCRRVTEAKRVLNVMAEFGLRRGEKGLQIYMMCEVPNNILLMDQFAGYFDGFSIGSNDLTQLVLGVDRESNIVDIDFDERDPGVRKMLQMAVEGAKRNGKYISICGQAPSDYPEIAEFLVRLGIDALSLNPDTVLRTSDYVYGLEQQLQAGGKFDQ